MTNDQNKISEAMNTLREIALNARQEWLHRNRDSSNWITTHDEIVKLREQCDLLLSPEYLGSAPRELKDMSDSELCEMGMALLAKRAAIVAILNERSNARIREAILKEKASE